MRAQLVISVFITITHKFNYGNTYEYIKKKERATEVVFFECM